MCSKLPRVKITDLKEAKLWYLEKEKKMQPDKLLEQQVPIPDKGYYHRLQYWIQIFYTLQKKSEVNHRHHIQYVQVLFEKDHIAI